MISNNFKYLFLNIYEVLTLVSVTVSESNKTSQTLILPYTDMFHNPNSLTDKCTGLFQIALPVKFGSGSVRVSTEPEYFSG